VHISRYLRKLYRGDLNVPIEAPSSLADA